MPALGDRRLRDLKPAEIRVFYARLGERLSPKLVRNVHVALSNALSLAVSDGYLFRNVAKAREVAANRSFAVKMNVSDARAASSLSQSDRGGPAPCAVATDRDDRHAAGRTARLALVCCRSRQRGAARGDRPDRDARPRAAIRDAQDRAFVVSRGPRCCDRRGAAFAPQASGSRGVCVGSVPGPWTAQSPGLSLPTRWAGPLPPAWVSRRFTALAKAGGLPRIRLHDLRQTPAPCCACCVRARLPMSSRQRLGHASPSITMDVYAHACRGSTKRRGGRHRGRDRLLRRNRRLQESLHGDDRNHHVVLGENHYGQSLFAARLEPPMSCAVGS